MSLLGGMVGIVSEAAWYIIPFIVILSVVVFFHELGHYLVGRWCGVKIDVFSLGFGPEIAAWVDRRGTRWRLAALPLGGYVRFHGDANATSAPDSEALQQMPDAERRITLSGQAVYKRAAIVAAGPLANFLLAIVIFTATFAIFGQYTLAPRVGGLEPGSPAEQAGFKPGDIILSINGGKIDNFEDLHQAVTTNAGLQMTFEVDRAGSKIAIAAMPTIGLEDLGPFGKRRVARLGIKSSMDPADRRFERCSLPQCVVWSVHETWSVVEGTGAYLTGLFAGRQSADQISGPIGVAKVAGEVAKISILALISLTALFSVSVGLMNLLPIPMLDGGHLLFYLIEALRGRPLSERSQEIGLRVGIAIVAMIVIFSVSNDLLRHVLGSAG
ncbi:MAG TPA: RIP metalloprotease RseP [Roseiarcus sp.]|nr:RIP metalloprotease RseP [Roseiarcus sp.]